MPNGEGSIWSVLFPCVMDMDSHTWHPLWVAAHAQPRFAVHLSCVSPSSFLSSSSSTARQSAAAHGASVPSALRRRASPLPPCSYRSLFSPPQLAQCCYLVFGTASKADPLQAPGRSPRLNRVSLTAHATMAEPSPPPVSNAGLRILLSKDRPAPSPPPTAAVSSHADRDRIIVS